ncbi:MAG TPA: hypothetical protein PKD51_06420 [Saprospiraceae bacterium]|nr:hypothetical protein [Saprospiraceae bacterium]HMU05114.1 hypothetical protein [Saprospiraceae bacterium]
MKNKSIVDYIPLVGITIFVALYLYSSMLYPGGSQADLQSVGYDWVHNYWCNLMDDQAINGRPNPAKPFAILAMIILCLSLLVFFMQFALVFEDGKIWGHIIKWNATLSMSFAMFMFTSHHDVMTMLSSLFGLFVVIGIIRAVYRSNLSIYKIGGFICLVLLGINNYIYYSLGGIAFLPLVQKITFVVVLIWILGLHFEMVKMKSKRSD